MTESSIGSFFSRRDFAIVSGRMHIVNYGRGLVDPRRFLEYRGSRFNIFPGPLLDEFEKNSYSQDPSFLDDIIEQSVQRLAHPVEGGGESSHTVRVSRKDRVLRSAVFDLIQSFSFDDVLAFNPEQAPDQSVPQESLQGLVSDMKQNISHDSLNKAISARDVLIMGGVVYGLEYGLEYCHEYCRDLFPENGLGVRGLNSQRQNTFLHLSRRTYVPGSAICSVDEIVNSFETIAKERVVRSLSENHTLRMLCNRDSPASLAEVVARREHYDQGRNIGFLHNDSGDSETKGFYVYSWTPSYILLERKTGKHFKFPPACVGVKLVLHNDGTIEPEQPRVINNYSHPGMYGYDRAYGKICFDYYVAPEMQTSTSESIARVIYEGCKMLMANYNSIGTPYHKLYRSSEERQFADFIVEGNGVDPADVTNLAACRRAEAVERRLAQNA